MSFLFKMHINFKKQLWYALSYLSYFMFLLCSITVLAAHVSMRFCDFSGEPCDCLKSGEETSAQRISLKLHTTLIRSLCMSQKLNLEQLRKKMDLLESSHYMGRAEIWSDPEVTAKL